MRRLGDELKGPLYDYLGHFANPEHACRGHNDIAQAKAALTGQGDPTPPDALETYLNANMSDKREPWGKEKTIPMGSTPSEQNAVKNMESKDRSRSTYAPQDRDI